MKAEVSEWRQYSQRQRNNNDLGSRKIGIKGYDFCRETEKSEVRS